MGNAKKIIKGLILDIDGILIGGQPGINFPYPNNKVISALQHIQNNNILVSLCTAKPNFSISTLIKKIGLKGVLVANGGSVIVNGINCNILLSHELHSNAATRLIKVFNDHKLYCEAYTINGYAVENSKYNQLTETNIDILGVEPEKVKSLEHFVVNNKIVKIMPAAYSKKDKKTITNILLDFPDFQLSWGANPMYAPILFGVVTKKGITKKSGADAIAKYSQIPLHNFLGIGDGLSDWEFMKYCGYAGTLENADKIVQEKVKNRGGYIGHSVDKNGILDIFKEYNLVNRKFL